MNKNFTTDSRPHLLPGIHAWLAENFSRVYVTVLTDHPKFIGPAGLPLVKQILPVANPENTAQALGHTFDTVTLNLGIDAVGSFHTDAVGFSVTMRFNQKLTNIFIPYEAVHSIYTPDNLEVTPFQFVLRPEQVSYCVESVKNGALAVVNDQASSDTATAKPAENKTERQACHLRLVK